MAVRVKSERRKGSGSVSVSSAMGPENSLTPHQMPGARSGVERLVAYVSTRRVDGVDEREGSEGQARSVPSPSVSVPERILRVDGRGRPDERLMARRNQDRRVR